MTPLSAPIRWGNNEKSALRLNIKVLTMLTPGSWPSSLQNCKKQTVKPPSLWFSVTAAWTDWGICNGETWGKNSKSRRTWPSTIWPWAWLKSLHHEKLVSWKGIYWHGTWIVNHEVKRISDIRFAVWICSSIKWVLRVSWGLPWRSSGWNSVLSLQKARVRSLVGKLRFPHSLQCGKIKIKKCQALF